MAMAQSRRVPCQGATPCHKKRRDPYNAEGSTNMTHEALGELFRQPPSSTRLELCDGVIGESDWTVRVMEEEDVSHPAASSFWFLLGFFLQDTSIAPKGRQRLL